MGEETRRNKQHQHRSVLIIGSNRLLFGPFPEFPKNGGTRQAYQTRREFYERKAGHSTYAKMIPCEVAHTTLKGEKRVKLTGVGSPKPPSSPNPCSHRLDKQRSCGVFRTKLGSGGKQPEKTSTENKGELLGDKLENRESQLEHPDKLKKVGGTQTKSWKIGKPTKPENRGSHQDKKVYRGTIQNKLEHQASRPQNVE